jgi:hypothetical protein
VVDEKVKRRVLAQAMPNLCPNLEAGEPGSSNMTDHESVSEASKLVTSFQGYEREVLAFIANVDTAFEVINLPRKADTLYKFVLTWGITNS